MNYLPMYKLGARATSTKVIQVGIFLPGVDSAQGYAVSVALVAQAHSLECDIWPITGSVQIDLNGDHGLVVQR